MKCWYCEKGIMQPAAELGVGWWKCPDCGATWIEVPEPSGAGYIVERGGSDGGTKGKGVSLPKSKKAKK